MKNKRIIIYSILVTGLLIFAVNTGWCAVEANVDTARQVTQYATQQGASVLPFASVLKKFMLTMGGVLLSLAVIWFGLNAYKKFTVRNNSSQKNLYNDGLRSPKTVDEAIIFFINKNRLK